MSRTIVVLNAGSSSIKFDIYEGSREIFRGQVSGLGATPQIQIRDCTKGTQEAGNLPEEEGRNHEAALLALLKRLDSVVDRSEIVAVGHRIVHGGHLHTRPRVIDEALLADLEGLVPLAPLHQPHNLSGVRAARHAFPKALQIACFDTAFHRGHPWTSDAFAIPREYYDEGVRRYGFHGLSYEYILTHLREHFPELAEGRVVAAHLGNGASMCGMRGGLSQESTMGFTALDGLPMGTRCGSIDPGVLLYLMTTKGMSADEITNLLYKQSGLKGLSGISQDMRELAASHSPGAKAAIDYFITRIRSELGALAASLGGLDTLVFTGGIGENSAQVRAGVCASSEWLGLSIDPARNMARRSEGAIDITAQGSRVRVMVIPANEEEMIRRHTLSLLEQAG